ncbi:MAG: hypothetical protein U5N55_01680 [Cypionkella sp.]|nr:hypothetical protein [Cypionkella sp.]
MNAPRKPLPPRRLPEGWWIVPGLIIGILFWIAVFMWVWGACSLPPVAMSLNAHGARMDAESG